MENKLKHRVCRIFQSSFTSCRTKNISDVIQQPFFFPENQHHRQLIDLFSPKPSFSSSLPKQKHSKTQSTNEKRPKISDRTTLLASPTKETSITTSSNNNIFYQKQSKKKPRSRKTNRNSKTNLLFSSITANYYRNSWYSSSDEDEDYDYHGYDYDEQTTLFSSRSLSSDSSESFRKHKARMVAKNANTNAKAAGVVPVNGNGSRSLSSDSSESFRKHKAQMVDKSADNNAKAARVIRAKEKGRVTDDSFAVVKKSSDPYNDFRNSMVEMIVEKKIFGAKGLENLLQCFLSLNSDCHHRVIVKVFTEILEALFSDSSF